MGTVNIVSLWKGILETVLNDLWGFFSFSVVEVHPARFHLPMSTMSCLFWSPTRSLQIVGLEPWVTVLAANYSGRKGGVWRQRRALSLRLYLTGYIGLRTCSQGPISAFSIDAARMEINVTFMYDPITFILSKAKSF